MAAVDKTAAKRRRVLVAWEHDPERQLCTIANAAKVDIKCAKRWVVKFQAGDCSLRDDQRAGRTRKLSTAQTNSLRRHLNGRQGNTIASATRMINRGKPAEQQVSTKTVRRALRAKLPNTLTYGTVKHAKVSEKNSAARKQWTTDANIKRVKRQVHRYVFLDAAIVSFKPGHRIKAFRIQKGWNDSKHARQPNLHGWKQMQYYSAFNVNKAGVVSRFSIIPVPSKTPNSEFFISEVAEPKAR